MARSGASRPALTVTMAALLCALGHASASDDLAAAARCGLQQNRDACSSAGQACMWLAADSPAGPLANITDLTKVLPSLTLPAEFNVIQAGAACAALFTSDSSSCPEECTAYLTSLDVSTLAATAAAVCQLKSCPTNDTCFEDVTDFAIKNTITGKLLKACLPSNLASAIPSCWPAGGSCLPSPGADPAEAAWAPVLAPGMAPGSKDSGSNTSTCNRQATSYAECALAGGANCTYSAYCSMDYNQLPQCYMENSQDSCHAMDGCVWQPYGMHAPSPSGGPGDGKNVGPDNGTHTSAPGPAPGQPTWPWNHTEQPSWPGSPIQWLNLPSLTPQAAFELLAADAVPVMCDALGRLHEAVQSQPGAPACEQADLCSGSNDMTRLQQALSLLLPDVLKGFSPCSTCQTLLADVLPEPLAASGNASEAVLTAKDALMTALSFNASGHDLAEACNPILRTVLDVASQPAMPPQALAQMLCSNAQVLSRAISELGDDASSLCSLLGQGEECTSQLAGVLDILTSAAEGDEQQACPQQLLQQLVAPQYQFDWGQNISPDNSDMWDGAWWENPNRHGHGPRDVITPPIATALLQGNLQSAICDAVSSLLSAPSRSLSPCEAINACDPNAPIQAVIQAFGLPEGVSACDVCQEIVTDVTPITTVLDVLAPLNLTEGIRGVCPDMVAGILQLFSSPSPDLPPEAFAGAVCPAVQSVLDSSPGILQLNAAAFCQAVEACDSNGGSECECTSKLDAALAAFNANPSGANQICIDMFGGLTSSQRRKLMGSMSDAGAPSPAPYNYNYSSPPSGYCTRNPALYQSQCYQHYNRASCASERGCSWNQDCYQDQTCSPGDNWCQQRVETAPICKPLVRAFFGGGGGTPSAMQLCTTLDVCDGANSSLGRCNACVSYVEELFSSIRNTMVQAQNGDFSSDPQMWAVQQCANSVSQVMEAQQHCSNISTVVPPSFNNAEAVCQQFSDMLCDTRTSWDGSNASVSVDCSNCIMYLSIYQDLTGLGIYSPTPEGVSEYCYRASLASSPWGLIDSMACRPSADACCQAVSSTSYLHQHMDLSGVQPTPSACNALPGCATRTSCWPVNDPCQNATQYGGQDACLPSPGCRWQSTTQDDTQHYPHGGFCYNATASDLCSRAGRDGGAQGCAALVDMVGLPVCQSSYTCEDTCQNCKGCTDAVTQAQSIFAALANQTLYADAAQRFCMENSDDKATCDMVKHIVQLQPSLARRPAALCKAIGQCSDDCIKIQGLDMCYGAPTSLATGADGCRSSRDCPTDAFPPQDCSALYFSDCSNQATFCNGTTGADMSVCVGTCRNRCDFVQASLDDVQKGRCHDDTDCSGGLTCQEVAGKACQWGICSNGAVVHEQCKGWCLPPATEGGSPPGPTLDSAQLSNDGRQISLQFSQDVSLSNWQLKSIFSAATIDMLGGNSRVLPSPAAANALLVALDYKATVQIGASLSIKALSSISSAVTGVTAQAGSITLQAPDSPVVPSPLIAGPTILAPSCNGGSRAVVLDSRQSPASAGRGLSGFAWSVLQAAGSEAALQTLTAAAASSPKLEIPAALVQDLPAGDYQFQLQVSNWLGQVATTSFMLTKQAGVLPDVQVLGGQEQEFMIASGFRLTTHIDLRTVCSGTSVSYAWEDNSGLLATSFVANRSALAVKGPLTGLQDGDVLSLGLTATLSGLGSTVVNVSLTARASPVVAVLRGPRGSVLDSAALTWDASSSLDPDDRANLSPFSYTWGCTVYDPDTQLTSLCFTDSIPAEGSSLTVPAGTFTAGKVYTVTATASKGSRNDTDSATVIVLPSSDGAAPTGTITRFCPKAVCQKTLSPTEPLRLQFALDDPSLAPHTTYVWSSADINLAGTPSTRSNLVVQPFSSTGAAQLPDGARLTFTLLATAHGVNASSTITVAISRRPACTSASCLAVSPSSGSQDSTAFVATASDFAADETLSYDFGRLSASGKRQYWARSSQQATFTFAAGTLDAGNQTLFVCARGATTDATACSQTAITVDAPAQPAPVTSTAVSSLGDALTTALASGSSDALASVARQLASVASAATSPSGATDATVLQQVAQQTAGAIAAMADVASGAAATASSSDALALTSSLDALTSAPSLLTPEVADQALAIATSAAATLAASGAALAPEDLNSLVNVAGNAAAAGVAALAAEAAAGAGSRRRLQQGASSSAAAAQALYSVGSVVSDAQSLILATLVAGEEAASMGTGTTLSTAVAVVEAAGSSSNISVAVDSGAGVTFPAGLSLYCSADCPASFDVRLTHSNASLLLSVVSASLASPLGSSSRRLLVDAPQVSGAISTTVVSGAVNFTSGLDGLGATASQPIAINVPLDAQLYDGTKPALCMRLDTSGYWRSDSITLASVDSTASPPVATCALSNLNNNQVLVVNYELPEGGAGESPSPEASPSPSPASPSPSPAFDTVSLPAVSFTAHITTFAGPDDFDATARAAYSAALTSAVAGVDTRVLITDVRAGSVYVDSQVLFLVSNNNSDAAQGLLNTLQTDPAAIFPPATYGTVGISSAALGSVDIAIDPALLSAPDSGSSTNIGAIVGGAVGGGLGGLLLLGLLAYIIKTRRSGRTRRPSATVEVGTDVMHTAGTSMPAAYITPVQPKTDGQ